MLDFDILSLTVSRIDRALFRLCIMGMVLVALIIVLESLWLLILGDPMWFWLLIALIPAEIISWLIYSWAGVNMSLLSVSMPSSSSSSPSLRDIEESQVRVHDTNDEEFWAELRRRRKQ